MNGKCQKHGIELRMKFVHVGTPYEDFDGYYCPECEKEREEAIAKKRAEDRLKTPEERKIEQFESWVNEQAHLGQKDIEGGRATYEQVEEYLSREVKIKFKRFYL